MGLNESKGNMYEWITHTKNYVKGECPHGCSYCYMKRWGKQNPMRFDRKELNEDLGNRKFIFVGSSCDMFANEVNEEWLEEIMAHLASFDNWYLFQSKNPSGIVKAKMTMPFPSKAVACTTLESNRYYPTIMMRSPSIEDRVDGMRILSDYMNTYVTIEPIMKFDLDPFVEMIKSFIPLQVNIGADSGGNNLPEPSRDEIEKLIERLEPFTTVKIKPNLKRLLKK